MTHSTCMVVALPSSSEAVQVSEAVVEGPSTVLECEEVMVVEAVGD